MIILHTPCDITNIICEISEINVRKTLVTQIAQIITDDLVDNLRNQQNLRDALSMKTTRNHLCKSVKYVGEAGGLYVMELSVRLLSYCTACRE